MYGVEVGVYLADDVGSLVGLAKHCVEVYGVVRGLVSVGILADEPGDVGGCVIAGQLGACGEELVECLYCLFA